jgi:hypothetical protein
MSARKYIHQRQGLSETKHIETRKNIERTEDLLTIVVNNTRHLADIAVLQLELSLLVKPEVPQEPLPEVMSYRSLGFYEESAFMNEQAYNTAVHAVQTWEAQRNHLVQQIRNHQAKIK